jgi:hypothetical protein
LASANPSHGTVPSRWHSNPSHGTAHRAMAQFIQLWYCSSAVGPVHAVRRLARPSSTPSRPPSRGNNGNSGHRNKNKNNNKNRNGSHDGGNNGRNNNGSGGRNSSPGQTTAPTASDGRTGTPWSTYDYLWQGHMTVYPGPVPTGQQCPQAFMATPGPYPSPGFLPGQQQQQPLYQQAAPAPSPGWNPWIGTGWDQQLLAHSFNIMALHPPPTSVQDWVADSSATHRTTPSVGNISTPRPLTSSNPPSIIVGNGSSLPITAVGDSVLPGPFYLNNILLAPDMIQSLFSVRRFTTDNWCSMEFDPFG